MKEQDRMRAIAQDAILPCSRLTAHIYQQGSMTMFQVAAYAFDKRRCPVCLRIDANEPDSFRVEYAVNLLKPVALTVGAGANDMVFDATLIECQRETIEQHRFARVGRAANQYSRE